MSVCKVKSYNMALILMKIMNFKRNLVREREGEEEGGREKKRESLESHSCYYGIFGARDKRCEGEGKRERERNREGGEEERETDSLRTSLQQSFVLLW